jgi:DNA-directed RNA polymerase specialized sigma24 family protein
MPVDYRGSSYEDIDRLIRSEVLKACRTFGVDIKQHGDDLVQEGWVIVLRKLPVYKDMGYKVTTYLFAFIRRDVRAACARIRKNGSTAIPVEDDFLGTFADRPVGYDVAYADDIEAIDWDAVDDLVLLQAAGYTDREIAELTGEQNISRRRQRALRELCHSSSLAVK